MSLWFCAGLNKHARTMLLWLLLLKMSLTWPKWWPGLWKGFMRPAVHPGILLWYWGCGRRPSTRGTWWLVWVGGGLIGHVGHLHACTWSGCIGRSARTKPLHLSLHWWGGWSFGVWAGLVRWYLLRIRHSRWLQKSPTLRHLLVHWRHRLIHSITIPIILLPITHGSQAQRSWTRHSHGLIKTCLRTKVPHSLATAGSRRVTRFWWITSLVWIHGLGMILGRRRAWALVASIISLVASITICRLLSLLLILLLLKYYIHIWLHHSIVRTSRNHLTWIHGWITRTSLLLLSLRTYCRHLLLHASIMGRTKSHARLGEPLQTNISSQIKVKVLGKHEVYCRGHGFEYCLILNFFQALFSQLLKLG